MTVTAGSVAETDATASEKDTVYCNLTLLDSSERPDATENRTAGFDRVSIYGSDCEDSVTTNVSGFGREGRPRPMSGAELQNVLGKWSNRIGRSQEGDAVWSKLAANRFWRGDKKEVRTRNKHVGPPPLSIDKQKEALKKWHAETGNDPMLEDKPPSYKGTIYRESDWLMVDQRPVRYGVSDRGRPDTAVGTARRSTRSFLSNGSNGDEEVESFGMTGGMPFNLGWI